MASIEVEMNPRGVMAVLKDPGVLADLLRRGNAVASAANAGGGFHLVTSRVGASRARVSVITANDTARRRESTDRNLTRALDAARRG